MSNVASKRSARTVYCLLILALLSSVGSCTSVSRWQDAARLVADVSSAEGAQPSSTEVSYGGERRYLADLYRPDHPYRAALVLVHGFTADGKNDPRLQHLAGSLAHAGFLVLVPHIESLTRFEIGTDNQQAVADSLDFLARYTGKRDHRLGAAAISYSAGPALLAALHGDTRVTFFLSVGGYYDLVESVTFATTGFYRDNGRWRYREPASGGRWLLLLSHLHHLASADDRHLLRQIAQAKLQDPAKDVRALRTGLSIQGKAAYQLVTNRDPQRVPALIEQLPASLRDQVAALDLARHDLSKLDTCVILIHGEHDPMIPAQQSEALARALPSGKTRLFIVSGLGHVDTELGPGGAFTLWRSVVALLEAAEEC